MRRYYSSGRLSQHLLWLAALAGAAGLLASRALVALSPVVGALAALANPQLRQALTGYFRNGAAMRAAALVAFLALSGLYTSDLPVWRHELFRSLTWLAVPLAFAGAVPLAGRQRLAVGALFVLGAAAVGLATMSQFLLDPASGMEAVRVGQNMQAITLIFHIPFGLMLAQAFFWALLLRRHPGAGRWLRLALLAAAAAVVLVLHVLAYRTGLLVFYVGLVAWALRQLLRRRVALALLLLALVALGPLVAYHALPSVRQRVEASDHDVKQFLNGHDINSYSLARRLAALETAVNVVRQHWLVGVGPADTHAAMMDQYSWKDFGLRPANRVEVHNQYLKTMVGGGLLGLGLWLAVLFGPLAHRQLRRNPYVGFFILTQATVMMVSDQLSLQIGLNLFVFGYGFLVVAGERQADESGAA